ncbi:EspG family protein [Actinokineospora alba]|uniref:EspG family protein n=1 Tax=Actinokineospora alba TaxID=504798 RepID=A0A1H0PSF5_9PSEU|nr:ESX secretion-associated protein EspG [Actinokineospora alba]TDP65929.1 ESAT-6 protein secretion system EspG family protein [Actinokineospora alba]SDI61994.1 EspG family protein [Actinokineospora alba]SDP08062.1 EspG family protein [Actinokineospora alba]
MSNSVVLSTLEFDVLWESERLPERHVALDVPSPGRTHTERRDLVAAAFAGLEQRGLAEGGRAVPELADSLSLVAHAPVTVDSWVWTDHEITALSVANGDQGMLAVVDGAEVWLIPARGTAMAEAAVSIAGDVPAGPGRSVSLPTDILTKSDHADPQQMINALTEHGVSLSDAQMLGSMVTGMTTRGQFGAERAQRGRRRDRAERVVSFHDTDAGRYLYLTRPSADGRLWSTITPADNARLATCVRELLDEL